VVENGTPTRRRRVWGRPARGGGGGEGPRGGGAARPATRGGPTPARASSPTRPPPPMPSPTRRGTGRGGGGGEDGGDVVGEEAGVGEGVEERLENEVEGGGGEGAALRHAAHGQDDRAVGEEDGAAEEVEEGRRVASMAPRRSEAKAETKPMRATPTPLGTVSRSDAQSWQQAEGSCANCRPDSAGWQCARRRRMSARMTRRWSADATAIGRRDPSRSGTKMRLFFFFRGPRALRWL
jgi:hypothetical protein